MVDLPVIIGAGQLTNHAGSLAGARSPLDLMAECARLAAADAGVPGALARVDSVQVVNIISWAPPDPAGELAAAVGAREGGERIYTVVGGDTPQRLVNEAAMRLTRGEIGLALIAGAEAMHSLKLSSAAGSPLPWPPRSGRGLLQDRPGWAQTEIAHGALLPARVYPMFENAIRAHRGWSIEEHRGRLGEWGARFSAVAAANPNAWFRKALTSEEVTGVGATNRLTAFPYTKRLNAFLEVDQGAALLLASESVARDLGVPREEWVYLHGFAHLNDLWFLSERQNYWSSPAIARAARLALGMASAEVDGMACFDLYSCFPSAVETAREAIGIPEGDPRPLTVTGGLPYFGGPGNNYVTHSIATMAARLRERPGELGLVTGLGMLTTKHSVGIYGAERPGGDWSPPDLVRAQAGIDAAPHPAMAGEPAGPASIETYTVAYGREGRPESTVIIGRLEDGRRFFANGPTDEHHTADLTAREGVGLRGRVAHDRATGLNRFDW